MGPAAFGKTRQDPLRPRLRAQRGRALQPRRAVSTVDVPQEEWVSIPVPTLVEPEVFAALQEQWREHQRHARQSQRGALYLLAGLGAVPALWLCVLWQTAQSQRPYRHTPGVRLFSVLGHRCVSLWR